MARSAVPSSSKGLNFIFPPLHGWLEGWQLQRMGLFYWWKLGFSAPGLWTQTEPQTLEHKYLLYVEDEAHHTHFPSLAL